MGENAPASLSAERNKGESMTPLFCKTRNLNLKPWIATKRTRGLRTRSSLELTRVCTYMQSYAKNNGCIWISWKMDTGEK